MESVVVECSGLVEGDTGPGRTCTKRRRRHSWSDTQKPKDLSVCESEENGGGEGDTQETPSELCQKSRGYVSFSVMMHKVGPQSLRGVLYCFRLKNNIFIRPKPPTDGKVLKGILFTTSKEDLENYRYIVPNFIND